MDADTAGYKEARFTEIKDEMKHMLVKVGWKDDFVKASIPFLPISGWEGDNLIKRSTNMGWWSGSVVKDAAGETKTLLTLLEALNSFCGLPIRKTSAALRVPVSGIYKIKGVGDVLTGRIEQGI